LVKRGKSAAVTAKVLGIPNQTLDNWRQTGIAGAGPDSQA
jgi:hypothetical protein